MGVSYGVIKWHALSKLLPRAALYIHVCTVQSVWFGTVLFSLWAILKSPTKSPSFCGNSQQSNPVNGQCCPIVYQGKPTQPRDVTYFVVGHSKYATKLVTHSTVSFTVYPQVTPQSTAEANSRTRNFVTNSAGYTKKRRGM